MIYWNNIFQKSILEVVSMKNNNRNLSLGAGVDSAHQTECDFVQLTVE